MQFFFFLSPAPIKKKSWACSITVYIWQTACLSAARAMDLPFRKDLEKYKDLDEDEILGKLTEEELKQLETVLDDLDPEVCIEPAMVIM